MIRIALPKGRMGDKVYSLFESTGYGCRDIKEDNRKLVFVSDNGEVSYVLVKPSDVTVYVERGACDLGVVGKDVLTERASDVYELSDLGLGRCRIAVAGRRGAVPPDAGTLKVATKYPHIAKAYYEKKGRQIDIIELHGSIELAPLLGMSDVIVDIVETGATLKENDMEVFEVVGESSARLIANKSAYNLGPDKIRDIVSRLESRIRGTEKKQ